MQYEHVAAGKVAAKPLGMLVYTHGASPGALGLVYVHHAARHGQRAEFDGAVSQGDPRRPSFVAAADIEMVLVRWRRVRLCLREH